VDFLWLSIQSRTRFRVFLRNIFTPSFTQALADMRPVGCFVAGAGEASGVYKGFHQLFVLCIMADDEITQVAADRTPVAQIVDSGRYRR
jgi:hypothetical protein